MTKSSMQYYKERLIELFFELEKVDPDKDPINFMRKVLEAQKLIEITQFKSWKDLEELLKKK